MDPNFLQQLLAAFGQRGGGAVGGMVGGSPRMPLPMPAGTPYGLTGPGGGGLPGAGPMPAGGPQIAPPMRPQAGPTDPAFYGPGLGGSPQGIPPPQTHPAMYGAGVIPPRAGASGFGGAEPPPGGPGTNLTGAGGFGGAEPPPGSMPRPAPVPMPPRPAPMPMPPPAQAGAPPMPGKETYGGPWGQDDPAEQLRKWRMLAAMGGQVGQDMPGGLFGVAERSY